MKTNYLLPAAVALMAHSALLFGVVSAPAIISPDDGDETLPDRIFIPLPFVEELIVDRADDAEERERTAEDVSFSPERAPRSTLPVLESGGLLIVPVEKSNYGSVPLLPGEGGTSRFAGATRVFKMDDLDDVPRVRSSSAPGYPFEARKSGLTGEVIVEFVVNERGEVESPRAVRTSDSLFVESALKAAARWKFEPGRKDGRPVRFRMAVPFVFTLDR